MTSRSRSRKSSRSSAKNSFKSASILEQGGQPALRHDDTLPPSPSTSPDEIEHVLPTARQESPLHLHPSDSQSPLARIAASISTKVAATEAATSVKSPLSEASALKSESILQTRQPPLQQEDTSLPSPSDTATQEGMGFVPHTPHLPHSSPPGSWPAGGETSTPAATGNTAPMEDPPLESHYQGESVGVRISSTASGQRDRLPHKRFGLNRDQLRAQPAQGSLPMDYKQKYPEDPIYKETDSNARVFHVYNDESQIFDNDMILEAGDNLDILLVFAGLFASVLTTFVAQTSQSLSPDKTDITNSLLREMISLQRAQENGTSFSSVSTADTSFAASQGDIWVNSLWFVSLALSLSAALLAVIAKQWLRQYSSFISGTPRERALIRQFRYDGLEKWRVRLIIGLLPSILHIALFLFMIGLITFLIPLNNALGGIVACITGLLCTAYIITNFLPTIFIQCPYRTPLSEILNPLYGQAKSMLVFVSPWVIPIILIITIPWVLLIVLLSRIRVVNNVGDWVLHPNDWIRTKSTDITWPKSLKEVERKCANEGDKWGRPLGVAGALLWLVQTTSDISAKAVFADAVGSVPRPSLTAKMESVNVTLEQQWLNIIHRVRAGELLPAEEERVLERLMRGALMSKSRIFWMLHEEAGYIHCKHLSTMLIIAVYGRSSRLEIEDGKWRDLSPNQVFDFIAEGDDLSTTLEAPTSIWWPLFIQATGSTQDSSTYRRHMFNVDGDTSTPWVQRKKWLNRVNIPMTLRYAVQQHMFDHYSALHHIPVSRPVPPDVLSEFPKLFYDRARYMEEEMRPPPSSFQPVSLATFLSNNFAQFTGFWMETGEDYNPLANTGYWTEAAGDYNPFTEMNLPT